MYPPQPQQRSGPPTNQPAPVQNSLSSFVTHAKALESLDRSRYPEEFAMLSDRIRELTPLLRVHGILDVMQIKNPEVAALIGA